MLPLMSVGWGTQHDIAGDCARSRRASGFGMSDSVVYVGASDADASQLATLVDEFLANCSGADAAEEEPLMMTTLRTGADVSRKLTFQSAEQAARFLMFWKGRKAILARESAN